MVYFLCLEVGTKSRMATMTVNTKGIRGGRSVAGEYFALLGRALPRQSGSDEFYVLPRVKHAGGHVGTLDDPDPDQVQWLLARVGALCRALPTEGASSLEDEIDRSC